MARSKKVEQPEEVDGQDGKGRVKDSGVKGLRVTLQEGPGQDNSRNGGDNTTQQEGKRGRSSKRGGRGVTTRQGGSVKGSKDSNLRPKSSSRGRRPAELMKGVRGTKAVLGGRGAKGSEGGKTDQEEGQGRTQGGGPGKLLSKSSLSLGDEDMEVGMVRRVRSRRRTGGGGEGGRVFTPHGHTPWWETSEKKAKAEDKVGILKCS